MERRERKNGVDGIYCKKKNEHQSNFFSHFVYSVVVPRRKCSASKHVVYWVFSLFDVCQHQAALVVQVFIVRLQQELVYNVHQILSLCRDLCSLRIVFVLQATLDEMVLLALNALQENSKN